MKTIEASVLAFDRDDDSFKKTAKRLYESGIRNIHYDVMDKVFVPNIAYNGEMIDYLRNVGFKISVHLMVMDVQKYVNKFLKYDIDYLTFHCEPIDISESKKILKQIKKTNIKAGIAIKPKTNIKTYKELIELSDIITMMGVEPGFGGQKYIDTTTERLQEVKKYINKDSIIQLDGGVTIDVINITKQYVDFFVSGSFLVNYKGDISEINNLLKN